VIDSRIALVVFTVLFTIIVSSMTSFLSVDGIDCTDPSTLIEQPGNNATTVDKVIDPANDVVNVFFGCSSTNPVIDGVFLALQAGIVIVLLFIAKDLVPFT